MKKVIIILTLLILVGCSGDQTANTNTVVTKSMPTPTQTPVVQTTPSVTPTVKSIGKIFVDPKIFNSNTKASPSATPNMPKQDDDTAVFAKIKQNAEKDHPDDYTTQRYVYDTQVKAYKYMKTIPASSLKKRIEKDHPYDFVTPKYVYDTQMEDKKEMEKR